MEVKEIEIGELSVLLAVFGFYGRLVHKNHKTFPWCRGQLLGQSFVSSGC